MQNKFLVSINNLSDIEVYKKVGVTTFLFPLEGYTVGYPGVFSVPEINDVKETKKYVLINRILNSLDIDNLKELLPKLKVKGLVFEDIGVFNLVKKLNLDLELIFFPNHFNTNYYSINAFLDKGIDSAVVSNEITKDEIEDITKNAIKPVVLQVFGYNMAMYSRRLLLDNYAKVYNLEKKNPLEITESVSKHKFLVYENEYGTVLYDYNVFNGESLLSLDNVLYFLVNTAFLDSDEVIKFLTGNYEGDYYGFLEKETIFKLRDE